MTASPLLSLVLALSLVATALSAGQRKVRATELSQWEPIATIKAPHNDAPDDPDTLVLRNGTRFNTGLFSVRFLGFLPRIRKAPYMVLVGVGCTDCDGELAIYVQSPVDGPVRYATQVTSVYPGPAYPAPGDSADTSLSATSRVFIGQCMDQMANGLVWFAAVRDSLGWQSRVHIIDVVSDRLRVRDLQQPMPRVSAVMSFVRAK